MSRRIKNLSPEAREKEREAQRAWHRENYEYINISARKGLRAKYNALAEAHGMTLSSYVRDILDGEYEKTFGKKVEEE